MPLNVEIPDFAAKFLPLVQAAAAGKQLEFFVARDGVWHRATQISFSVPVEWYRVKPEPKLRPWTLEEVPIGGVLRARGATHRGALIICPASYPANKPHIRTGNNVAWGLEEALRDGEWKWPHELDVAWRPCGIEE